jgi:hypothetical protein
VERRGAVSASSAKEEKGIRDVIASNTLLARSSIGVDCRSFGVLAAGGSAWWQWDAAR